MVSQQTEISAEQLRNLISERFADYFMAFVDLFTIGCLLHLRGQTRAGLKLIDQVRRAIAAPGHATYLAHLLAHLPGNGLRYAGEIHAHLEVNELFDFERKRLQTVEDAEPT